MLIQQKWKVVIMNLRENERIDDLQYKGLKIIQDKTAFCFGIDSVLLSDFAKEIKNNSKVADLGTGNGIVGLLLCKKTKLNQIRSEEHTSESSHPLSSRMPSSA